MGMYEICFMIIVLVALFELGRSFFTLKPSPSQREKVRVFLKKKYSTKY